MRLVYPDGERKDDFLGFQAVALSTSTTLRVRTSIQACLESTAPNRFALAGIASRNFALSSYPYCTSTSIIATTTATYDHNTMKDAILNFQKSIDQKEELQDLARNFLMLTFFQPGSLSDSQKASGLALELLQRGDDFGMAELVLVSLVVLNGVLDVNILPMDLHMLAQQALNKNLRSLCDLSLAYLNIGLVIKMKDDSKSDPDARKLAFHYIEAAFHRLNKSRNSNISFCPSILPRASILEVVCCELARMKRDGFGCDVDLKGAIKILEEAQGDILLQGGSAKISGLLRDIQGITTIN